MKAFKGYWLVGVGLTVLSGVAQAVPFTWTDSYNPDNILLRASDIISFAHDITDEESGGFQEGGDTIVSATLKLWLYDDNFFGDLRWLGDGEEYVILNFDGMDNAAQAVDGNFLFRDAFQFSLADLLADGLLDVTVTADRGDFYFGRSELKVRGERAALIPEPGTLALFAVGLIGLGLGLRRRWIH